MARPAGSRNRSNLRVKELVAKLDRSGRINLAVAFETLYAIGTSASPDRTAALRTLLGYAYGLPRVHLDVEHNLSKSAEALLTELAHSEQHARAVARVEEHRRQLASSTTVESEGDSDAT